MPDSADQQLSRQQRKLLQKKLVRELQKKEAEKSTSQEKLKSYAILAVAAAIILYIVYLIVTSPPPVTPTGPFTSEPVHWHADLAIYLCGERKLIPAPFGEEPLGLPLLHTHTDRRIHIEGQILKKEDIALGKFFDAIGVDFSETSIMDFKNDSQCNNGKPNKVSMTVNGQPNSEFRNFSPKDGDSIEIRYE